MNKEKWVDLEGYEKPYRLYENGVVIRLDRGYILKQTVRKGLRYVRLGINDNRKYVCLDYLLHKHYPEKYPMPKYQQTNNSDEEWKDIKGYEGLYQISNCGRIRSVTHTIVMKNGRSKTVYYKVLKTRPGKTSDYLAVILHDNCEIQPVLVHRMVAEHFIGHIPEGMVVNHKNGYKHDNTVSNLEIVTPKENIHHAIETGLNDIRGEKHYRAKLTNLQAEEIRRIYKRGNISQSELGRKYGLKQTSVFKIVHNKTYKNENYIN